MGRCWPLPAFSPACRKQMSAGPFFFSFFLLWRTLRGALPVGCTVGNKTEKKIAKNQNHQKRETKKWLKLESSGAGTDFSPREAAEGTPRVRSPTRPEAFASPAGLCPSKAAAVPCSPARRFGCRRTSCRSHRPTGCGGTCAFSSRPPLWQSYSSSKHMDLELYLEAASSPCLPCLLHALPFPH